MQVVAQVGHTLGTYNLAMLQLSRDASSCPHALELLKKVAGVLACCLDEDQVMTL